MASKRYSDEKPELKALYRLEFYKNKKKWKLSSEKAENSTQSSSHISSNTESNNFNQTYDLESKSDQKKTIALDNASLHTKKLCRVVDPPLPPSPTWPASEETLAVGTSTSFPQIYLPETNIVSLACTQPLCSTQDQHICSQTPPTSPQLITENTWTNQDTINNNHWSQKPKTVTWKTNHQSPSRDEPYSPIFQHPKIFPFKKWSDLSEPLVTNQNIACTYYKQSMDLTPPILPNFSTILPSNNSNLLQESTCIYSEYPICSNKQTFFSDSNIPQAPSPDSLSKLLCPNSWQSLSKDYQNYQGNSIIPKANPNLGQKQNTYGLSDENPFVNQTYVQDSRSYGQQILQEKCLPDNWIKGVDSPQFTCLRTNQGLPMKSLGLSADISPNFSPSINDTSANPLLRRQVNPEFWTNHGIPVQKKPNIWINPALVANTGQNFWDDRNWEQHEDCRQNNEQDWGRVVADTLSMEEDEAYLEETEQLTLTPLDKYEEALADARRDTHECLRKLIMAYKEKEKLERGGLDTAVDKQEFCDMITGEYQDALSESAEFIRGAKYVPHSSEKDPNDTNESDLAFMNTVLMAPPGLLSASREVHVATVLRDLLMEQQWKEQRKQLPMVNSFEYPTRDTDPYDGELLLDGSHLPHDTALLEKGVIKINMGRPYRL